MAKICNYPNCTYPQFGGGYCRNHQWMRTDKKPKEIKNFSDKREAVNVIYNKQARIFRLKHPVCEIRSPVCIEKTQGVHHKKGKSTTELLLDERWWKGACNPCNGYVESHHQWAVDNGHRLSKHNDHDN